MESAPAPGTRVLPRLGVGTETHWCGLAIFRMLTMAEPILIQLALQEASHSGRALIGNSAAHFVWFALALPLRLINLTAANLTTPSRAWEAEFVLQGQVRFRIILIIDFGAART